MCYCFCFSSIHPMPIERYPFVSTEKVIGYWGTLPNYSIIQSVGALTTIG
jgi:hypothetical protein